GWGAAESFVPVEARRSAAQDLVHRLPLRELVDQLVEVADLAHERIFDLLHAHATDHAFDELARRVKLRGLVEEQLEILLLLQLALQLSLAVASLPADDRIHLVTRAALLLRLFEVQGVNAREA